MNDIFEFDEARSSSNEGKHGIDFTEAQKLWLDEAMVRVAARTGPEPRFIFVGMIGDKHWSAVTTYRNGAIRLISVRRSRIQEVHLYESE